MDALCASRCADLDGIVARDAPSDVLAAAVRAVGLGLVVSDGPLVPRRSVADPAAATATLSMRERQVLAQVATGASNAAIAHCLVVSTETVKSHVAHILAKLGVPSRAAAVDRAIELGALASVGAEIVPHARTAPASR